MGEQGSRRDQRYALREKLWATTAVERFSKCGRTRVVQANRVEIAHRADVGAYYRGVHLCASVHACPCCAPAIRSARAGEVEAALAPWINAGNSAELLTLTMPHDPGERLEALLTVLAKGSRALFRGEVWMTERTARGVVGMIRALEVTYGENGWHPHLHILLVVEGKLTRSDRVRFHRWFRTRWADVIKRQHRRAPDTRGRRGCDLRAVWSQAGVAAYVAKWEEGPDAKGWGVGQEIARGDLKTKHPFTLLERAAQGDTEARAKWREYEHATKGRYALRWSVGLRARLGVVALVLSDEELLEHDVGGKLVATLTDWEFSAVAAWRGGLAGLLQAAEEEGPDGVGIWLAERGILDPLRAAAGPDPGVILAA